MNETITQEEEGKQSATVNRTQRERKIKKLITKYEETIFAFFRELKIPTRYREIVRAFIIASGGETVFEASYRELTNILFKSSSLDYEANRASVRHTVKNLLRWQKNRQIQLVRLIEKGRKKKLPEGGEEYLPSRYELILLDELVKVLHEGERKGMEQRIKEAVARIKGSYVPEPDKPEVAPRYMMERWRKSAMTLFGKTMEQAEALNINPVEYGRQFLSDLSEAFCEFEEEYFERQNRRRRIEDFLSAENAASETQESFEESDFINDSILETYNGEGVQKHHINEGRKIHSDKHLSFFPPPERAYMSSINNVGNEEYLNKNSVFVSDENLLLEAAIHYARTGIPVFPLQNPIFEGDAVRCSCRDSQNCDKDIGKHPLTRYGSLDATTDLETIQAWWSRWPQANIGLLTGRGSNLFVLDVDPRSGGDYSLEHLQDTYGELPATLTAVTGSGGRHLFFKYPDVRIRNSTSLIARGLDIKSEGGYVVAAQSVHKSGAAYEWHGVNTAILDAPDWLIALILLAEEEAKEQQPNKQDTGRVLPAMLISGEKIKEGEGRNEYLFGQARGLVNSYGPEEVRRRIQAKNLALCVPPVDDKELEKLIKSAESYLSKSRLAA